LDLSPRARGYIYVVVLIALATLVFYLPRVTLHTVSQVVGFVVFAVLGFFSEIYATWIPIYGGEISSSIAIYLASLFILGPANTVLLVFVTTLSSEVLLRWEGRDTHRSLFAHAVTFNVAQLIVTVGATGILFVVGSVTSLSFTGEHEYVLAVACFVSYALINLSLVTGIVSLSGGRGFLYALRACLRDFGLQYLVLCVLALLLGVLNSINFWYVFMALIPLVLVHVSFRSYMKLQTEARKTFERISRLLDERDHYTAVHSTEVAELSVQIAQEMGLSERDLERVDIAARVHDIGKVAVPDAILLKPGPLDEEEWKTMKRHPEISADLIESLEIYAPVAHAVRHEHERWDGSGYPDGLKGEEIPLLSRVIAAADIFNALTTDRPYRKAYEHSEAVHLVQDMRGADLDPQVADALIRVIKSMKSNA